MQYLLSADQPEHLQARDLLPDQPGFIVAIDGLLTQDECDSLISAAHSCGLNPPRPDDLRPKKGEAFLNRESLSIVDEALLPHVPVVFCTVFSLPKKNVCFFVCLFLCYFFFKDVWSSKFGAGSSKVSSAPFHLPHGLRDHAPPSADGGAKKEKIRFASV